MKKYFLWICSALGVIFLSGCTTPKDYTAFIQHQPKSVLVLPPLSESVDMRATYGYLSTVTRPLAEMGYYVYPVAVIDQFLKENGLPTPGEMHQIPLNKISEIVGADAVLYITVKQYGTKYQVIDSVTVVQATARMVDVKTGLQIWEGSAFAQQNANQGGGIISGLIVAALNQAISSGVDQAHPLSATANAQLVGQPGQGLLYGVRHPKYQTDRPVK